VSHDAFQNSRVVTLLRGDALRDARGTRLAPDPPLPANVCDPGSDSTIYGVPVSAVQHCCGRGCKHCRIYWHRMKT
jgi:hypothetical protein